MNETFVVTTLSSNVELPKEKLEHFINKDKKHHEIRFDDVLLPNVENISWHSVYTPVSGDLKIGFVNKKNGEMINFNFPVQTWFLVSCTKRKFGSYKLTFGISLS